MFRDAGENSTVAKRNTTHFCDDLWALGRGGLLIQREIIVAWRTEGIED